MDWLSLILGGGLVLIGYIFGSVTAERAQDRTHKWVQGIDPDKKG